MVVRPYFSLVDLIQAAPTLLSRTYLVITYPYHSFLLWNAEFAFEYSERSAQLLIALKHL
ncbi:Uncharacterised protein [Vibrio cholerae]|nr:Uncharacterised protein [Vibrio cholerae]